MNISDAHFHLNMKMEEPIQDALDIFAERGLRKVVLILNRNEEKEAFLNNIDILMNSDTLIHPAVLLDINDMEMFEKVVKVLYERKIAFSVKLHSRISKITQEDFGKIDAALRKWSFENIIIDAFYYGSCLEYLNGVELAIYLAKRHKNKKIIIAHFGGVKILETMLCTRELSNIYYDISCTVSYFENTSIWKDVFHCVNMNKERVMFGSDYPDFTVKCAQESVDRLFKKYGMETKELYQKLMCDNIQKVY